MSPSPTTQAIAMATANPGAVGVASVGVASVGVASVGVASVAAGVAAAPGFAVAIAIACVVGDGLMT
jgi:hypothetical protein